MKVCSKTKPEEVGKIIALAKESGLFKSEPVSAVYMPGGLTNRNFKVFVDGKFYAFRLAGEGTAEYLNRPSEKDCVSKVSKLGIAPAFYYYDPSTGSNVAEFVEGETMTKPDFCNRSDILEHAAKILRTYHKSGIELISVFDPFTEIENYRQYLKDNNWSRYYDEMEMLYEIHDRIKAQLKKNPLPLVCSHNDCLSENFLYDFTKDEVHLIDWEYCGMNFYTFDIAAVISENDMEEDKEEEFMRYYFEGEPTERQRAEVLVSKFIMDGLWVPWALVQSVTKVDERDMYWDWGYVRVRRCLKHMSNPNFERYLELVGTPE